MKKLLLLSVLLFSFGVIQAQSGFGVRGGANFASLANMENTHETKTDFYLGVFGNIRLGNIYAMQPEIDFSRQGASATSTSASDIDLNYISLKFMNKFYFYEGLHAMIGPGLDIEVEGGDSDILLFSWAQSSGIDFSINLGVGYELSNGLVIEARYKQGLLERDFFGSGSFSGIDVYNQVVQIGVGYKFSRKKSKK